MKRLLFPAFVLAAGMLSAAACDPDLTPVKVAGEGGAAEGGGSEGGPIEPVDSGSGPTDSGAAETGTDGGPSTTHKIDGTNDFTAGEKFQTTSSGTGYFGYVAWDTKNVYFGMEGADVSSTTPNAGNKWVLIYLGRDAAPGSTTGIDYAGQQEPTLPFAASLNIRIKMDGMFSEVQESSGGAWTKSTLAVFTQQRSGTFLELAISRATLGNPTKLRVHMNMLIEGGGLDHTYAGIPSTSFADGKDPDFGKYFEFDLSDLAKAPNTYPPK